MGKKVFITGGSGFLGSHLSYYLSRLDYTVLANYFQNPRVDKLIHYFPLDLNSYEMLEPSLIHQDLDIIVHTAYDKENKDDMIVKSTENIIRFAEKKNIPVIYLSSDLVFSGKNGQYMEDDYREPLSDYGKAKVRAEHIIESYSMGAIVRTSLIYCLNHIPPHYFFIQENIEKNKTVMLHVDEVRNPIYVDDLVFFIHYLIESFVPDIFHFAGSEAYTRFELGWQLTRVFFPKGLKSLRPSTMEQTGLSRAANCTLNSLKAREWSGIRPRSLSQLIKEHTECQLESKGKNYVAPELINL